MDDAEILRDDLTFAVALSVEGLSLPTDAVGPAQLSAAAHLVATADRALHQLVVRAREGGASWAQIGEALGISRQAAQHRFGAAPPQRVTRQREEPPAEIVAFGAQVLDELAQGITTAADAHLGAQMSERLEGLGAAHFVEPVESTFGRFISRDAMSSRLVGGVVVLQAREHRSIQDADVRVILGPDRTILGMSYELVPSAA